MHPPSRVEAYKLERICSLEIFGETARTVVSNASIDSEPLGETIAASKEKTSDATSFILVQLFKYLSKVSEFLAQQRIKHRAWMFPDVQVEEQNSSITSLLAVDLPWGNRFSANISNNPSQVKCILAGG